MRGRSAVGIGLVVWALAAPAASEPRPALRVDGDRASVPVQVSGGMHAFGLTPFELRDMATGDYLLRVQNGTFAGGSSRLRVGTSAKGPTYDVGSVRWPLVLRSALLPGLGHLQSGQPVRGGSALAQTFLSAARTWGVHREHVDANDALAVAEAAYQNELDSEQLSARREALFASQAEADETAAARTRWLAVTGWAYGTSLLDLVLDSRPVASLVADSSAATHLVVRATPVSRGLSLARAAVHPGSGHYALNHRWRGLAFEVLSSVALAASLELQSDARHAGVEYDSARRAYEDASEDDLEAARGTLLAAHANWSEQRERHTAALYATGAVWLLNIVDVWFAEPVPATSDLGMPKRLAAEMGPNGFALRARF